MPIRRGLTVTLAQDAIAPCEPEHACISLDYLAARAVSLESVAHIAAALERQPAKPTPFWVQRNPSDWNEILDQVALNGEQQCRVAAIARALIRQPSWQVQGLTARREGLQQWAQIIESRRAEFVALMAREIAQSLPRRPKAKWDYALTLLHHCLTLDDEEHKPARRHARALSPPRRRSALSRHGITRWQSP